MIVDKRRKEKKDPSREYITQICELYGDVYDDREEDSRPGGDDWQPGVPANHTSLVAFQKTLKERGIILSTAKIRKILITGGVYTTERSREVAELFERYKSVKLVAAELRLSTSLISMYLPYGKTVYDLEEKSGNARRVARWREKKAVDGAHS